MMEKISRLFNKNLKLIFWAVLLVQLITMLLMSQQAGISADEYRHISQASKVYKFYETKGENRAALENTGIDPMQYNGQSFDNLMYFLTQKFKVENYMEMRHFFNALIAWLIILITGFIAKEFWGWKGALLAIFILFISPRFLGHAMNNNKDIPFAFGFMLSFYGTLRFIKDLPELKIKSILLLLMGLGAAISIRIAGILSIGFFGLFCIFHYLVLAPVDKPFGKEKAFLFRRLLWSVPAIAIAGYFLGILFWPFMMDAPIENLKKVLDATSSHPVSLNQLFEGRLVMSNTLPSYYSLKWVSISYPLIVFVGAALGLAFWRQTKKENAMTYGYIVFALVFVLAWMSLRQSNFYGAIRHLLFIYPVAVLVAVIGFQLFSSYISSKVKHLGAYIPIALVLVLSIHPIAHLLRNYPYSYVYFNELSGGMDKVKDKYETDYFQHSIRFATEWLIAHELSGNEQKVVIASNDDRNCRYWTRGVEQVDKVVYTRYYEKYAKDWDYGIYYCGYITPEQISNGQWPPAGTIHTETVDGFPIAAVVKRQSKEDLAGYQALSKNPAAAKAHFERFLASNAPNEQILEAMAKACLYTGEVAEAQRYVKQAVDYNPRSIGALWTQVSILMATGQLEDAVKACDRLITQRPGFYQAHYQKGVALRHMGKPNDALKAFVEALKYNPRYYEAYMQMGEIYINYKQYQEAIDKIYGTVAQVKANDLMAALQTAKCFYFLKQDARAEQILNQVPAKFHQQVAYVNTKARLLIRQGQLAEATQLLASIHPENNAEYYLLQGLLIQAQGDSSAAKAWYKKALKLDPYFNEAKDLLK